MGHARALLSLDNPQLQIKVFREILKNSYSVRKVEEICQQLKNGEGIELGKKKFKGESSLSEYFENARAHLSQVTGQNVKITCNASGKGKLSIPFASEEELQRILDLMQK